MPTTVENTVFGYDLNIYPIPATITATIKSPEPINAISIMTISGNEIIKERGDGSYLMDISVDKLPAGYYFVKINNLNPVKIIKQ